MATTMAGIEVSRYTMKKWRVVILFIYFLVFLAQQAWTTQKRTQYGTSPFYTPPAQTTGMSDSWYILLAVICNISVYSIETNSYEEDQSLQWQHQHTHVAWYAQYAFLSNKISINLFYSFSQIAWISTSPQKSWDRSTALSLPINLWIRRIWTNITQYGEVSPPNTIWPFQSLFPAFQLLHSCIASLEMALWCCLFIALNLPSLYK